MSSTEVDQPNISTNGENVAWWPHLIPVIGLVVIALLFAAGGIGEGGSHSIDDIVVCVLALGGIAWIVPGSNRHSRSFVPLGLVSGALVMKLLALAIEHGDTGDLGDDTISLVVLAVLLIVSGLVYFLTRRSSTVT